MRPHASPMPADRKPPLVPSHIAWPAFIVFLLTISITMAAATAYYATADGGVRMAEDPAPVVAAPAPAEASADTAAGQ